MRLKPARQSMILLGKAPHPVKGMQWVVGSHTGHGCCSDLHNYNKSFFVGSVCFLGKYPQQ